MHRLGNLRHNPIADKAAFEAWQTEGTLSRAQQKLAESGVVSTTGRPFSQDGIRKASIRYLVNNYDEAKKFLLEEYEKNGYEIEEFYVEQLLVKMAVSALHSPQRIKNWMVRHDLLEKHRKYLSSMIAIPND